MAAWCLLIRANRSDDKESNVKKTKVLRINFYENLLSVKSLAYAVSAVIYEAYIGTASYKLGDLPPDSGLSSWHICYMYKLDQTTTTPL